MELSLEKLNDAVVRLLVDDNIPESQIAAIMVHPNTYMLYDELLDKNKRMKINRAWDGKIEGLAFNDIVIFGVFDMLEEDELAFILKNPPFVIRSRFTPLV